MNADLLKNIFDNYNIGPIVCINPTSSGSGNTYYVETNNDKFIAKLSERPDFVSLYNKVQPILSEQGFIQSKIVRTKESGLMTLNSMVLYTCLTGDTYNKLDMQQIRDAIRYMKNYNMALLSVPFTPIEIKEINNWDRAKSLFFLVNDFEYVNLDLGEININRLSKAIQILRRNSSLLNEIEKQLIHTDLGPDNFIYKSNKVQSIIDFTPEYENEIYSLCQFCYWNYLWLETDDPDLLDDWLSVYHQRGVSRIEKEVFYTLLVKASLFRVAGILLSIKEKNKINSSSLIKRMEALKNSIFLYERNN